MQDQTIVNPWTCRHLRAPLAIVFIVDKPIEAFLELGIERLNTLRQDIVSYEPGHLLSNRILRDFALWKVDMIIEALHKRRQSAGWR